MLEGDVNHDRITRLLSKQDYKSKDLWLQVKAMVRSMESAQGALIFDDTIQKKAWTDESDLICWHYDHCNGRSVAVASFTVFSSVRWWPRWWLFC